MIEKVLIVEDQFIEANDLRMMLDRAGYTVCGIARSVDKARELIAKEKPSLVLLDIFLKGPLTGIDLAKELHDNNIAFIYLSANSNAEVLTAAKATQPYGFLVKPFREKDLLVTLEIAQYRHENSLDAALRKEAALQQQLSAIVQGSYTWEQKLLQLCKALQPYLPFDYMTAGRQSSAIQPYQALSYLRTGFDEYRLIGPHELMIITNKKMDELQQLQALTLPDNEAAIYNTTAYRNLTATASIKRLFAETFSVFAHLSMPVTLADNTVFHFDFYSRRNDTYEQEHLAFLARIQPMLVQLLQNALPVNVHVDIRPASTPATDETVPMPGFEGIVGRSHLLLNVFDHITQVAPVDTSVLILGESGTGKERIAQCIHDLSPRKKKPLVKINCAALPATLIESELFGHEKGAFTGAVDKRIGKFEQADGGTLFLDEIGEMPLELQAKMLRVLQEKEIERIGGKSPVKIDVRIVAATNRNLEKEVGEGRFRLDLYYRLNIFPVELPPLRERKEDIPLLTEHFIQYYNRKAGKRIAGVSDKVMQQMLLYHWPGNIRELEHLVERAVLLAKNNIIEDLALPAIARKEMTQDERLIKTIDENERDHIIYVLKKCKGKVWGEGGAAELLNIPPTTLASKMKKLGIQKELYETD